MTDRLVNCPNCEEKAGALFYTVHGVPVHSVMLLRSREDALAFPTGDIELTLCPHCGFIFNRSFEAEKLHYSLDYEETQGFSPTFNAFHKRLAEDLIDRHELHGKRVIEIGCGKGDFLNMLCHLGPNTGLGFDPSYRPERDRGAAGTDVTFIQDLYSDKYSDRVGDFVCCKMTLEHIPQTAAFMRRIRSSLDAQPDATVFFQIPDMTRVLAEAAFWDVYYEHCSYFTPTSLRLLFQRTGFEVRQVWTDYDDQYLMIEAHPNSSGSSPGTAPAPADLEALHRRVERFSKQAFRLHTSWREKFRQWRSRHKRVALWGGGSKAVAFLTTLGITHEVDTVVDINPYKRNTYLAGTGHRVVNPDDLKDESPDVVVIMNPHYRTEISSLLQTMELSPELVDITLFPD
jgi:hypothetical protein